MNVLFLMDSPEYLRFYDSAIEELASRGHSVALAVNSGRAKKPVGLEGLQRYADRVRVLGVVPQHEGRWAGVATGVRATMDFVRFLHPRFAAAHALRARIKRKVLPRAYHWIDAIPRLSPWLVRAWQRGLMALERAIPVCEPMAALLRAEAPDVLIVSPLVAAASDQVDWVKAAQAAGVRTAVAIASWDNLTNKGLLRVEPDVVVVWNEAQRHEAHEYHYIPAAKIAVTGAQLFDRWFDRRVTRDRAAFCQRVGLPGDGPFVLFTGSSSFISESGAEVAFVRRWLEAVRASGDPALAGVNVLMRPHPYNFHRWADEPLADARGVAVFPRAGYNPVDAENRADFFDSLFHASAVVGINTSAMVEAAIVGRPVLSMLAPEFAGTQEGTIHFHHLLPEHGGFLRIAATLDEHVAQLADRLRHPESSRAETARFVASFIRPHGVERPATPLFADAIERLAASPAPAPRRAPVWAPLLRPVVLALAAPVAIANGLGRAESRNRLRRRADGAWRRARKGVARTGGLARGRAMRALHTTGKRWRRTPTWRAAAFAYATVAALGIGYFLAGSPLQVSEALRNMLAVQRTDLGELLASQFTQGGFLRPLLLAQIDVPFELARGHYFAVFKAIHVAQVVLAAGLFVNLLPLRGLVDALAIPFGLALLFASHTFSGTVVEAFPINTFLTIVLCCLAAANLAQGAPSRWRDAAAVALFVFAALTVETGLLVWVCIAAAWLAGFRGVSGKAVAAATALLAVYMALRFGPLHVGAPALVERSSGFGFRTLDPPELIARFGDNPLPFYAYNVVVQLLTVLFAEPKAGVWLLVRGLSTGEWLPRDVLAVAATTGATLLIAWYVAARVPSWRRAELVDGDRWLFVGAAVLAGNAVISYPYTKSVIMSPAGAFHALAATLAFAAALARLGRPVRLRPIVALGVLLLTALSTVWTVRLIGLHYRLREKAFITRNDWMFVTAGQSPADVDVEAYPAAGALIRQLRDDAVTMRVPNPAFDSPRASRVFEEAW